MAYTKAQLLSLLDGMPDSTEIVVPSFRDPANSVTQIARHELGKNPAGESMVILVPASILPFRPHIEEASNDRSKPPGPDSPAAA